MSLLLGQDHMKGEPDTTTRHRTVVSRGSGLWWWQCRQCPDHFGYGNSWSRVFAAAERHALGRRLR